jgi:hypothetical protein
MAAGSPGSIKKVAERGYKLPLDQFAECDHRRAVQSVQIRGREARPTFDPMTSASAARSSLPGCGLEGAGGREPPGGATTPDQSGAGADGTNKSSADELCRYREAAGARSTHAGRDRAQVHCAARAWDEHVPLNGPSGSRENLRPRRAM